MMHGGLHDVSLTTKTSPIDLKPHSPDSSIHPVTDILDATKESVGEFLCRLQYTPPGISANSKLRREVADLIASWNVDVDSGYIEGLAETSCSMAESPYPHTSYEHQRLVAIYTACVAYIDDQGHRYLDALGQFAQRFSQGEPQLHPALDCLAKLLRTLYEFYTRISADAIITSTLDAATAMYVQFVSQDEAISPFATKYPYCLRLKVGIASAYVHFNFTKSWGDRAGTYYLQSVPELELMNVGFNDILSFYKETLAGETDNYVHMRANVEQKSTVVVLRELVEENLKSWYNVNQIASVQSGLVDICIGHLMGYVEFHFKARSRYRLHEIMAQP